MPDQLTDRARKAAEEITTRLGNGLDLEVTLDGREMAVNSSSFVTTERFVNDIGEIIERHMMLTKAEIKDLSECLFCCSWNNVGEIEEYVIGFLKEVIEKSSAAEEMKTEQSLDAGKMAFASCPFCTVWARAREALAVCPWSPEGMG